MFVADGRQIGRQVAFAEHQSAPAGAVGSLAARSTTAGSPLGDVVMCVGRGRRE
ncbi:hypothetical protein ACFQL4_21280 [Halosimplex aquaticum]